MTRITDKKRADMMVDALYKAFPDASCTLDHEEPERLAVRGILSAQCTDKRVNITSEKLFARYPEMSDLRDADPDDVAEIRREHRFYQFQQPCKHSFAVRDRS